MIKILITIRTCNGSWRQRSSTTRRERFFSSEELIELYWRITLEQE